MNLLTFISSYVSPLLLHPLPITYLWANTAQSLPIQRNGASDEERRNDGSRNQPSCSMSEEDDDAEADLDEHLTLRGFHYLVVGTQAIDSLDHLPSRTWQK